MNQQPGNCYVTSEALYHLLGGPAGPWHPEYIRTPEGTHWFLRHDWDDTILDATRLQFGRAPNYTESIPCGFLTLEPSRKARELMEQMLWKKSSDLSSKTTKRISAQLRSPTARRSR